MLNAFRNPLLRNSNPAHAGVRYNAVKCTTVTNPKVSAAESSGRTMPSRGYTLISNNCLDAANGVLKAYGVQNLPNPTWTPVPNNYFKQLNWPQSNL